MSQGHIGGLEIFPEHTEIYTSITVVNSMGGSFMLRDFSERNR